MPDYREKVFKMLDIKPYQSFNLYNAEGKGNTDAIYCFDNELNLNLIGECSYIRSTIDLAEIITNKYHIVKKIKFTDEELAAINYAKAIGCKWLAKDRNGSVYAFINKPVKDKSLGWWLCYGDSTIQESYEIKIPLSFLHWEDEEPYKI